MFVAVGARIMQVQLHGPYRTFVGQDRVAHTPQQPGAPEGRPLRTVSLKRIGSVMYSQVLVVRQPQLGKSSQHAFVLNGVTRTEVLPQQSFERPGSQLSLPIGANPNDVGDRTNQRQVTSR